MKAEKMLARLFERKPATSASSLAKRVGRQKNGTNREEHKKAKSEQWDDSGGIGEAIIRDAPNDFEL
jgi:hypothetical protein